MTVTVRKLKKGEDVSGFMRFPWEVYKNYPMWVPPIIQQVKPFLSGQSKFFNHCEYDLFIAQKDKKTIATAAIFIERNLSKHCLQPIGLIGHFEALPDEHKGVGQLFKELERNLTDRGVKSIWSPFNGNIMYGAGLGADAYDSEPLFMMPYTPPYYQAYFSRNGYAKHKKLLAYTIDLIDLKLKRKINYIKRRAKDAEVKIRPMDLKNFKEEVFRFSKIYSETFSKHWGYAPQSKEETFEMFEPFRMALEKDFVLFAEYKGETIGFVLCAPNFNSVIKELNGNLGAMNIFNFYRKKRDIKKARLIAVGVRAKYRKQNIAPLLIANAFGSMIEKGYSTVEYSWVLKENIASQRAVSKFYGKLYKSYDVYRKNMD